MVAFYTTLAPLEWQTGGSLAFAFTLKNINDKKQEAKCRLCVLERVGVRLFGEALVHNVHYMTACVAPAAGCAERTYNAHYVK